jgi:sensor histidine kinase YesM
VPPLILQPIIENAIKHNAKQTALTISINVKKIEKTLVISISDNGSGFSDEVLAKGYGLGIGMKNLQQRMLQLPKGKVMLSNGTGENSGATINIEMAV